MTLTNQTIYASATPAEFEIQTALSETKDTSRTSDKDRRAELFVRTAWRTCSGSDRISPARRSETPLQATVRSQPPMTPEKI